MFRAGGICSKLNSEHLTEGFEHLVLSSEHLTERFEHLVLSSEHLTGRFEHLSLNSEHFHSEVYVCAHTCSGDLCSRT